MQILFNRVYKTQMKFDEVIMQRAANEPVLTMRLNDNRLKAPINPREQQQAEDVARYIVSLLAPLAQMARGSEFPVLAYLLDMARLEAENQLDA
jgi:hypothetical protein